MSWNGRIHGAKKKGSTEFMTENCRFNRIENNGQHHYINNFNGYRHFASKKSAGLIKCKLAHHSDHSIIIPDQIYLDCKKGFCWIQPLYFTGNQIQISDHNTVCRMWVDVSLGACLAIEFNGRGIVRRLRDGSFLYKCKITGPNNLKRHATGLGEMRNGIPYLRLFHHTNKQGKNGIIRSLEFRTSSWNIQGNKKIQNISYFYITPLEKISCESDLNQIAMSGIRPISLRLDQNPTNEPDVCIEVSRKKIDDMVHPIEVWVRADYCSPQPIYRHEPPDQPKYHEVFSPFIQRIGVVPGTTVKIAKSGIIPTHPKLFEYMIVGLATTVEGLRAPYEEEDTKQIFKIEKCTEATEIIDFWINNQNTLISDGMKVELSEFNVDES